MSILVNVLTNIPNIPDILLIQYTVYMYIHTEHV